jgi:inner membrane protein involved in colicin E2 resistance
MSTCYCKYALGYFSLSFSSVYLLPVLCTAPTLYMLYLTVLLMLLFNLWVLQFPEAPLESSDSLLGSLMNLNITLKIILGDIKNKTDFYYRKFSYSYTLVIHSSVIYS